MTDKQTKATFHSTIESYTHSPTIYMYIYCIYAMSIYVWCYFQINRIHCRNTWVASPISSVQGRLASGCSSYQRPAACQSVDVAKSRTENWDLKTDKQQPIHRTGSNTLQFPVMNNSLYYVLRLVFNNKVYNYIL